MKDPAQIEWFGDLMGTFAPLGPRESGTRNDTLVQNALQDYPFQQISVPTLIIHGTSDKGLPIADAKAVAGRILGAELLPVENVGQLVFLGPKGNEVQQALIDFLKKHSEGQGQP